MSNLLLSKREWEAAVPTFTDSISIRKLHVVANVGFDIWGRKKFQPIDVSVQLSLSTPFESAAKADTLDGSTINYGKLSKALIAAAESATRWHRPHDFAHRLNDAIISVCSNASAIGTTKIDLSFPKASRSGEAAGVLWFLDQKSSMSTMMYLKNLRIPALIGVNTYERGMKQMISVSIWVDRAAAYISDCYCEAEQLVTKTVEKSTFETLESLAERLASTIIKHFILAKEVETGCIEPAGVKIRIEKPSAIPLAEAPIVEIYRSILREVSFGSQ